MNIRTLERSEIKTIYRRYAPEAFPAGERRPLGQILRLHRQGRYRCWGGYEEGALVSYAFLCCSPELCLLDYLATLPQLRGQGLGGAFLQQVCAALEGRWVLGEMEAPEAGADRALCARRIAFYERSGFAQTSLLARLFGVTYRLMVYGAPAGARSPALRPQIEAFYRALYGPFFFSRHVTLWEQPPET